jgi:hypothetical protein
MRFEGRSANVRLVDLCHSVRAPNTHSQALKWNPRMNNSMNLEPEIIVYTDTTTALMLGRLAIQLEIPLEELCCEAFERGLALKLQN